MRYNYLREDRVYISCSNRRRRPEVLILFPHPVPPTQTAPPQSRPLRDAAILTAITFTSFFLLGYHPFAEDAGIYLSGIHLALNPALYPASRAFVLAHMHLSFFADFFAFTVRYLHIPLAWALLSAHILLLLLLFIAIRRLAVQCFASPIAQWMAVALTAFCLSTPIAGTALFIADPWLTPRSFAAPFNLLLLSTVLDRGPLHRRLWIALPALLIALCFHPLMAIYGIGFALVLWTLHARRSHGTLRVCLAAVLAATIIVYTQQHVSESPAYIHAALTRTYFYLGEWQWYELVGLAAPLLLFAWIFHSNRSGSTTYARNRAALSGAALACGITAILISAIFVHPASHSHLLARLQPLRIFHVIYILLFLLLGGMLAEWAASRMQHPAFVLAPILCAAAGMMFFCERQTFPASGHLEMPWQAPVNPWQQAFLWARDNTPRDALFALDANYISTDGEDAQNFRATAERSSLSDYSKDGGSSAIFPQLAETWQLGQQRSANLSNLPDTARIAQLAPSGVTWVVLQEKFQTGSAQTHLPCPYRNSTVLVCQLPAE